MKSLITFITLALLFILSPFANGQTFTNVFGSGHYDDGSAICSTRDGNIVVAGSTRNDLTEGLDMYVVKFTPLGDTLWSIHIGRDSTLHDGFNSEESVAILENLDNEIIVCGSLHVVGAPDYHATILHEISPDGNLLESRLYEILDPSDMVEMDNGGYMISGTGFSGFALPQAHAMMIDKHFDIQWATQYDGSQLEGSGLNGICRLNANEYVVAGYSYGFSLSVGLLSGLDTLGNILWSTELFNGVDNDSYFNSVERFDATSFICAGVGGIFGYSKWPTISRFNTDGERLWQYTNPGHPGRLEYEDVLLTEDGNIAACGRFDTTYWSDETVGLFTLLEPTGEMLKSKLWQDSVNSYFISMAYSEGSFYLTGPHGDGGLDQNALFMRNNFYYEDSLCGVSNDYEGILSDFSEPFANFTPEFPVHGTSQTNYAPRIGRAITTAEICSHNETYDLRITDIFDQNTPAIYPNPFINNFRIDSPKKVTKVTIIELNGRIIPCELNHNRVEIISPIAAGIYVLNYELADGSNYRIKIVKE